MTRLLQKSQEKCNICNKDFLRQDLINNPVDGKPFLCCDKCFEIVSASQYAENGEQDDE